MPKEKTELSALAVTWTKEAWALWALLLPGYVPDLTLILLKLHMYKINSN